MIKINIVSSISIAVICLSISYYIINTSNYSYSSYTNTQSNNIPIINGSSVSCIGDGSNRTYIFNNIFYKASVGEFIFIRNKFSTTNGLGDFQDLSNYGFVEVYISIIYIIII